MSKNYWFKAKKYGWGWYPATWEGWLVMGIYIAALVWQFKDIDQSSHSASDTLIGFVIPFVISTVALFLVCYLKGEKPKWRWGEIVTKEELSVTNSEEMLDVLDENGGKTGRVVSNKEVHAQGLWHRVVHVYIYNSQNEILLQLRSPNMWVYPSMWFLSSGGHIPSGVSSIETAVEETREELGLVFSEDSFTYLGSIFGKNTFPNGVKNNEYVDIYSVQKDFDSSTVKLQKSEVSDIRWIPFKEYKQKIKDNDPKYVSYPGLPILFSYLEKNANS